MERGLILNYKPNKIKDFLRDKDISQVELAKRLKITPQWLCQILSGKFTYVKPSFLINLSKELGVTVEELQKLLKGDGINGK